MIDVHGHLISQPEDLDWIVESGAVEQVWLHALPDVGEMHGVKFATNAEVLAAAKQYPDFFLPFGYLDFRNPPGAIDAQRESGCVGLKAIFPALPYDHPSHLPHYERACALRMPILFHMGGVGPVSSETLGEGLSPAPGHARPCQLSTIAGEFPDLVLVGAHVGGMWQAEILEGIREYPNLYFEIGGGDVFLYVRWLIDHLAYDDVPNKILAGLDICYGRRDCHESILDRVKFWELFFRYLRPWFRWTEEGERILRLNALRIRESLGISGAAPS